MLEDAYVHCATDVRYLYLPMNLSILHQSWPESSLLIIINTNRQRVTRQHVFVVRKHVQRTLELDKEA